MNRGDARLFLTIISTAFVTVVLTLIISRMVDTRDTRHELEVKHQLADLDGRMTLLEQRMTLLEHPAPLVVAPVEAPDPPLCDEVACVLNNYEGQCCAKFKKAPVVRHDGPPDTLDREMISQGVAVVKADVLACADGDTHGQVKAHVRVGTDGVPAEVTIKVSPTKELADCVARVMQTARFPRTVSGGSFSYPFVF